MEPVCKFEARYLSRCCQRTLGVGVGNFQTPTRALFKTHTGSLEPECCVADCPRGLWVRDETRLCVIAGICGELPRKERLPALQQAVTSAFCAGFAGLVAGCPTISRYCTIDSKLSPRGSVVAAFGWKVLQTEGPGRCFRHGGVREGAASAEKPRRRGTR